MKNILWFIIGSISAILPVLFIKEYLLNKNVVFLILSMLCYLVLMNSYLNIFNVNELSVSYTIIQILQILIVVISGILLFKETITINKIIGILLAIISMYYLNR